MQEPRYKVSQVEWNNGKTTWRIYVKDGRGWKRHNKRLEFDTEAEAHAHAEVWLAGYIREGSPRI